jgi:hypothetical protein
MRSVARWRFLPALLILLLVGGCLDFEENNPVQVVERDSGDDGNDDDTDDPPPPPPPPPGSMRIHFLTRAGGERISRDPGNQNTSDAGEPFFSGDMQYMVSDFHLEDETRDDFSAPIFHFVDAATDTSGNTHFVTLEDIPPGTYTTLRFRMGLSDADQLVFDPYDPEMLQTVWTDADGDTVYTLRPKLWTHDPDHPENYEFANYFNHSGLANFMTTIDVTWGPPSGMGDYSAEVTLDLGAGLVIEEETTASLDATIDINQLYHDSDGPLTFVELGALSTSTNPDSVTAFQTMMQENATNAWTVDVTN